MFHILQNIFLRGFTAFELIDDNDFRYKAGWLEQFAEEFLGTRLIAAAVHQNIKDYISRTTPCWSTARHR